MALKEVFRKAPFAARHTCQRGRPSQDKYTDKSSIALRFFPNVSSLISFVKEKKITSDGILVVAIFNSPGLLNYVIHFFFLITGLVSP